MKAISCVGLLLLGGWAAAQEFRGGILGRVTDSTGAVIVGAAIRATNTETNVAASTLSNQDGNYQIPFLNPGNYNVVVDHPGFKKAERQGIRISVNSQVALDFSLDVGAVWEGYHGDAAVSIFVGAAPDGRAADLVRVTEASLAAGIEHLRAGARISDVGHAVQQVVEAAGFSVVREYVGHGVGRALHEDPQIPNHGQPGRGPLIRPGLVVAVEPMVNMGDWRTEVLEDDWTVVTADGSLSAHFEHTIAVTEHGPEVLTARR